MGEGKAAWQRSCCAFLVRRSGAEVRVGCSCPNLAPGSGDVSTSGVLAQASPGAIRAESAIPAVSPRVESVPIDRSSLFPNMGYTPDISQEADRGSRCRISKQSQSGGETAKAVALPEDVKRVDVVAVGRTRIITPAGESWDSWFEGEGVTADFMAERDQPAEQEREGF